MPEAPMILPNDTTFADLDFQELRQKDWSILPNFLAIYGQTITSTIPALPFLRLLCYALADLGYRTRLPIEDLLARKSEADQSEDNFFTPSQILTNTPLTIDDYRKLLLDIPCPKCLAGNSG